MKDLIERLTTVRNLLMDAVNNEGFKKHDLDDCVTLAVRQLTHIVEELNESHSG